MSVATPELSTIQLRAESSQERLFSLDLFRGITIAAMVVVNNQSSELAYRPLQHAEWNGWTGADLVFPFFLFIVGVSTVFSFQARTRRGATRRELVGHTLRRTAILFGIGLLLNAVAWVEFGVFRIPGVLQRIALAYCAAALLVLYCGTRARIAWLAGLLLGYWLLMRFVPVPGFGTPGREIPLLHPDGNLAAYLDRKFMLGHLWEPTRDPEGILSTLPAIGTALCGVLTGEWLRAPRSRQEKVMGMCGIGTAAMIAGQLWSFWFPLNKKLWTSSYVLLSAGAALICLAICYWLTDIEHHRGRWTTPFLAFGNNAITAYVLSVLIGGGLAWRNYAFFEWLTPSAPALASLLHSILVLGLGFVPVWLMYRRNIFLRI